MRSLRSLVLAHALLLFLAHPVLGQSPAVTDLPLGDPDLRERFVPLTLDALVETRTGAELTPTELAERLAGVRALLIGETHTSAAAHGVQLRVIQALHEAGRAVHLGLEMMPQNQQVHLDRWVAGLYTEKGFVELADWYGHWGYHWSYYRDILLYARDHGLPVHGLNVRRSLVSAVGRQGIAGLDPEDAAEMPPRASGGAGEDQHRELFRAYLRDGDEMHEIEDEALFDKMFEAQTTWDAGMADGALRALDGVGGDAILVVLVGSGHVAYGLGIERQLAARSDVTVASLIPESLPRLSDEESATSGEPVTVRASYADYLWGLPPEPPPAYPSLGLSLAKRSEGDPAVDGLPPIRFVFPDSLAETAGLQSGDRIIAIDGEPVGPSFSLSRWVARRSWGDAADFTVDRDGEPMTVRVWFRRSSEPGE